MMKKTIFCCILSVFTLIACKKENGANSADYDKINAIDYKIEIGRFDKDYFETDFKDIEQVKQKYPFFFPQGIEIAELLAKRGDSIWSEVYQEVKKEFPNNDKFKDTEFLFKAIKFYFPEQKIPTKLYTLVGDMEKDYAAFYSDSLAFYTLETYLGEDHKYYTDFPKYLRPEYNQNQMVQNMADEFAQRVIQPSGDHTLIANMVQQGKALYLKDMLLPHIPDNEKICYSPEQYKWCEENEAEIWSFLVENKHLYESDARLDARFVNKAPFSKFYLEIDAESPGRVGVYLGWQIVRSYMQNNDVDLKTMLQTQPRDIFEKSKYKPKK